MSVFVTIDGPNGVGKSTFINELNAELEKSFNVFLTKEPTETSFGDYVRKNEEMLNGTPYAYLIAADRCYHVEQIIKNHMEGESIIISDRYVTSSLVLQNFDGVSYEDIWRLNSTFPIPDLNIILLASEQSIQNRLMERSQLTYFERKMTRAEEINGYKKAAKFITEKGWRTLILYNETEADLRDNIETVTCEIQKLLRSEMAI